MTAAVLLLATAAAALLRAHTTRAAAQAGFYEPPVISSRNGVFKATLVARQGTFTVNGRRIGNMKTFNGLFPGPTLHMEPGDHVEITFVNRMNQPTNLHFHGFRVSPAGIADNVLRTMGAALTTKTIRTGVVRRISFDIPVTHQQGLYWYHPHLHGYTNQQVTTGLSGLIEVGDPRRNLPPELRNVPMRNLALQSPGIKDGKLTLSAKPKDELNLVNGRLLPTLRMRPGETQLWRVANLSNENWYLLQLTGGHVFNVIGEDGNPKPRLQRSRRLLLTPGKRFEFLVQGGRPGTYKLRTLRFFEGFANFPQRDLATLVVAGTPVARAALPSVVSWQELAEQNDLLRSPVDIRRKLVFSIQPPFPNAFKINSRLFMYHRRHYTGLQENVRLDDVEEWTLVNTSGEMHPFHIHTNDFLVMKINGRRLAANGFRDVIKIPRHGSVVIRQRYREFEGKAVFHCHILFHEDHAMMGIINIMPPA